ncbi:MAG: acylphosphatase [Candidatus Omnitrophica bacterium]|nr:acylphosphatase [Candidatus Omnitrophota bacterium]
MDRLEALDCFDRIVRATGFFGDPEIQEFVKKQIHLIISGFVQGVFFRSSASDIARSLSLSGYVRNLSNGKVELVAEGDEPSLRRLIEWCKKGPSGARVDDIKVEWKEAANQFERFAIR